MKRFRRYMVFLMCLIMVSSMCMPIVAAGQVRKRTVRIGFFSSEGYHEVDDEGTMSGYGYDFLQMLLRYNDWTYSFIGYDKNWGDMLDMLDCGEIDMVTLANKTPEREEKYDFSQKPIGSSSTIMTISAENTTIIPGETDSFDGARIGMVTGSSHNAALVDYAEEHDFSYIPVYYEDIADLLADLRAGVNIDIALTSNMRVMASEVVLDEFNSTDFYCMVRKGDTGLLEEINQGISQLNVYSPNWQTTLFEKYYSNINSNVLSFSADERAYLEQLKTEGTVIKAAMNPELQPYAYFEDGEAKGIAPTLFKEIAARLGLDYEILPSKDRWEYKEQLNSGEAQLDLTAYLDYGIAQKYNLKETDAYISSTLAMITLDGHKLDQENMTVGIVNDPTEYVGYNSELIYKYHYKAYRSIQDCISAVKKGEVDATFLYVYSAEKVVTEDYTNQLQCTIMSDYPFNMGIGVNNETDHRLLSILNKGVNSLSTAYKQGVMLEASSNIQGSQELIAVVYDHPLFSLGLVAFVLIIFAIAIILYIRGGAKKSRLLASYEMERFIGYVCESYKTVAEINLASQEQMLYTLADGQLSKKVEKYIKPDKAHFEEMVRPEDVDRMAAAFSKEKIHQLRDSTVKEEYIEVQIKEDNLDGEDAWQWYSYIVRVLPKDQWHPDNYMVFEKNIQTAKADEEKQRQILRDALAAAKSASAAKGTFLSRMSHEIRTPLNAVIGYMEIAKDSGDHPEKMMHCIENGDIAAKHLLSIINDVLDISSIENGKMKIAHEAFDLKKQLTAVCTIFYNQAREKDVVFKALIENVTQEWVIGDALRLNQVLMNLLSNAIKFTPKGGLVTLSVTQAKVDEKRVFMTFMVSDTGIGMSEEYQKKLFTPFEQESASTASKYGGTGLGLSITYNLIQLMSGSIEVHSVQNEGTTFTVSLYFDKSTKENEKADMGQDYSHVRALVVDDDHGTCDYMKALMKRCGVKCDTVHSGAAAIRRIKGRMGTDYPYNLCFMDWNMPEMDGIETARQIRKSCGDDLLVVIATAYDVTELEDQAKEAGVNKVVAKPLFQSTIFDLLVATYGKYEPVKKASEALIQIKGMKVLLAEDNPMNMEIAVEILHKAGLVVDSVTDGQQAVTRFTSQPPKTYDVILMDVQMPVMDGYQATGAIRRSNHPEAKTIPIIAMTANAFAEDVNAALASGMNGHIAKPVDYNKLYDILKSIWEK